MRVVGADDRRGVKAETEKALVLALHLHFQGLEEKTKIVLQNHFPKLTLPRMTL